VSDKFIEVFDKIKSYQFPEHWENIMDLIEGKKECMIFNISNTEQEWKNVEI
jgi:hypothetical protein